jgi:putative phosphoribosyl transferase
MIPMIHHGFASREDAGRHLAEKLATYPLPNHPLLLALPRGGVPVAAEVAARLGLPMDVLVVRKLGVPGHEEYAMGAIAGGGVIVLDHRVVADLGLGLDAVERVIQRETRELARRERLFRNDRPPPEVAGRTVIVVDDGIATGSTVSAAVQLLRHQQAARIIVATPVSARDSARRLRAEADAVLTLMEPADFRAVGQWYEDFSETTDEEVRRLLAVHGPQVTPEQ